MYKKGLKEGLGFDRIFRWIRYKIKFRREHPLFFVPCGTCIFCGSQGSGKTLSAVNYVYKIREDFPYCILCSNVSLTDYPFNAHLDGDQVIFDLTGEVVTTEKIISGELPPITVEYDGLDCLKYINNEEYGVLYLIDELHLELNSLESANIDIDVMVEISQQRKQRKHIVGTSQIFMRLAKPIREQIKDIILCRCLFECFCFNKVIDGLTATEENGKLSAKCTGHQIYFHDPAMYARYDTFAKMKRYNKVWKGHVRDQVDFFSNQPKILTK